MIILRQTISDIVSLIEYKDLLKNLVIKDLKLKYRNSTLGFLWSLVNPIVMIIVYTFAFKYILQIGIENYPLFLLSGIIPWTFFNMAVMGSTDAILSDSSLIKKISFPRPILPISSVVFNFTQFGLALVVFFPAVLFFNVTLTPAMLLYVPIFLLQFLFTVGIALFLSSVTVFYRDVKHLTEVALMVLFWLTPIIYEMPMIPKAAQRIIKFNPLTAFIGSYHQVIYRSSLPSQDLIVAMLLWTGISLSIGYFVFRTKSARLAENL